TLSTMIDWYFDTTRSHRKQKFEKSQRQTSRSRMASSRPGLRVLALLAVTAQTRRQDLTDERPVIHAGALGDQTKVRPTRGQARQWIDLDEVDPPARVEPEIDSGQIATAERVEHAFCHALEL